jgi:hypothetical protein
MIHGRAVVIVQTLSRESLAQLHLQLLNAIDVVAAYAFATAGRTLSHRSMKFSSPRPKMSGSKFYSSTTYGIPSWPK